MISRPRPFPVSSISFSALFWPIFRPIFFLLFVPSLSFHLVRCRSRFHTAWITFRCYGNSFHVQYFKIAHMERIFMSYKEDAWPLEQTVSVIEFHYNWFFFAFAHAEANKLTYEINSWKLFGIFFSLSYVGDRVASTENINIKKKIFCFLCCCLSSQNSVSCPS